MIRGLCLILVNIGLWCGMDGGLGLALLGAIIVGCGWADGGWHGKKIAVPQPWMMAPKE